MPKTKILFLPSILAFTMHTNLPIPTENICLLQDQSDGVLELVLLYHFEAPSYDSAECRSVAEM